MQEKIKQDLIEKKTEIGQDFNGNKQYKRKRKNLIDEFSNRNYHRGSKQVEFSKSVMRRDSYRCCICGFDKVLEAAHIRPIRPNKNKKQLEEIQKCGLSSFYDIRNGVTLCKNCHLNFDKGLISIDVDYRIKISPFLVAWYSEYHNYHQKQI